MRNINEILDEVTETSVAVFRNSYLHRGYSGNGSLFESIKRNHHTVVSSIAVATLIYGRRPGKSPPWGYSHKSNSKTSLMLWAMERFNLNEKQAKGVSYVIARKLKEQGNDVYRKLKPPIETEPSQLAAISKMNELVLNNYREIIGK